MACYFDEHDCEPLGEGQQPNHLLHLARLLIDSGVAAQDTEMDFESLFPGADGKPPPASKNVVENLPVIRITEGQVARNVKCPVCLGEYREGERAKELPCKHNFHPKCILPWLKKTNSCPLCRHELPTDDEQYEEFKKQKARAKQREQDIETLHSSMYG
ncbi:unnamed protein product [Owenia fusiformis]|uniref:E3 ubiquitin-protein ligase RNF181 n=1 Tax=Owenia fusiformis TaxID=6347 RepID=A0A8J1Y0B5_OWEFU|nr:unnamed protein product [Owenia fusiformis]